MDYRKIQKIGGSSYSITLPKEWINRNNLKEGSVVYIEIKENNDLIIRPKEVGEFEDNEFILTLEGNIDFEYLLRKIISIYLSGAKKVVIKSRDILDLNVRKAVEKSKEILIGIEIIEETGNQIIIQDLSKIDELPMEKMLSRLFLMGLSMLNDAEKSLINNNKLIAKDVIERDFQIDRIYLLISKQFYLILKSPSIISEMNIDIIRAFNIRTVAKYIERICDHSEKIAKMVLEDDAQIDNDVKNTFTTWFKTLKQILNDAIKSYSVGDEFLANSTIEKVNIFCDEITNEMKGMKIKNAYKIFRVSEDITRIARYSSDICETAINEITMRGKVYLKEME
jgi:phosphate uptake regulator